MRTFTVAMGVRMFGLHIFTQYDLTSDLVTSSDNIINNTYMYVNFPSYMPRRVIGASLSESISCVIVHVHVNTNMIT